MSQMVALPIELQESLVGLHHAIVYHHNKPCDGRRATELLMQRCLEACKLADGSPAFDASVVGIYNPRRSMISLYPDPAVAFSASSSAASFWEADQRRKLVEEHYQGEGRPIDGGGLLGYLFAGRVPQYLSSLAVIQPAPSSVADVFRGMPVVGVPLFYFGQPRGVLALFQESPRGRSDDLVMLGSWLGYVLVAPLEAEARTLLSYIGAGQMLGHEFFYRLSLIGGGLAVSPSDTLQVQAARLGLSAISQIIEEMRPNQQRPEGFEVSVPSRETLFAASGTAFDPIERIEVWQTLGVFPGVDRPSKIKASWTTAPARIRLREAVFYLFISNAISNAALSPRSAPLSPDPSVRIEACCDADWFTIDILDRGEDWGPDGLPDNFPYHMGGWYIYRYVARALGGKVVLQTYENRGDSWKGLRLMLPSREVIDV